MTRWIWSGWSLCAEMRGDDDLVLEITGSAGDDVVQVRVAELVNDRRPFPRGDKSHLRDQDLGAVDLGKASRPAGDVSPR